MSHILQFTVSGVLQKTEITSEFTVGAVLCTTKREFVQAIRPSHLWRERERGGLPPVVGEDRFFEHGFGFLM